MKAKSSEKPGKCLEAFLGIVGDLAEISTESQILAMKLGNCRIELHYD